jgi:hypothetical protein
MANPGELNRSPYTDGLRTVEPARNPRLPTTGGTCVNPPLATDATRAYRPACAVHWRVPCNCAFLRPATPGAPYVGFPEEERTRGRLQPSGRAWGRWDRLPRKKIGPPLNLPAHYGP